MNSSTTRGTSAFLSSLTAYLNPSAAAADGFKYAARLDRKADVPRVIEDFIRFKGPAVLEVMIDRDAGVYPMVGPGQGYSEMITGEHIPSRTQVEIKPPDASEMF